LSIGCTAGGGSRPAAGDATKQLIADHADDVAHQIARVHALRRDPDNTFKWLDRAWTSRDAGINYLLFDPFILRYRNDPRFAAFCKKVGLPTTTDTVAMKQEQLRRDPRPSSWRSPSRAWRAPVPGARGCGSTCSTESMASVALTPRNSHLGAARCKRVAFVECGV
jgi:hypothetical protein